MKACIDSFRQRAVAASLRQSVAGIEVGDGTAGNFLRFARRTQLVEGQAGFEQRRGSSLDGART